MLNFSSVRLLIFFREEAFFGFLASKVATLISRRRKIIFSPRELHCHLCGISLRVVVANF